MRVRVYRNLHKQCWSIQCMEYGHSSYGRVVAHASAIALKGVTPKVRQKGREKVLQERSKNVHAFLDGQLHMYDSLDNDNRGYVEDETKKMLDAGMLGVITYNPYKYKAFVYADTEKPFKSADYVTLTDKVYYLKGADSEEIY